MGQPAPQNTSLAQLTSARAIQGPRSMPTERPGERQAVDLKEIPEYEYCSLKKLDHFAALEDMGQKTIKGNFTSGYSSEVSCSLTPDPKTAPSRAPHLPHWTCLIASQPMPWGLIAAGFAPVIEELGQVSSVRTEHQGKTSILPKKSNQVENCYHQLIQWRNTRRNAPENTW